jgi:hypothetical protein
MARVRVLLATEADIEPDDERIRRATAQAPTLDKPL